MNRRRRDPHRSLISLALIGLTGVALLVLALLPLARQPVDGRSGSLVGQVAPELEAEGLDGRVRRLGEGGARVTWVNFWATSCLPCRTEMPAMQLLAEHYGDELLILGVDGGEERSAVADFVERYAIAYPILLDPTLENFRRWSSSDGLPRHYFVDRTGTVVREVVGELSPRAMVGILDELMATALAAPPAGTR